VRRDRNRGGFHLLGLAVLGSILGSAVCGRYMVADGENRRGRGTHTREVSGRLRVLRQGHRRGAAQGHPCLLADDRRAVGRLEPANQADVASGPTRFVPRNPDAVRVAELRLAVVLRKLLGRERVFSVRPGVAKISPLFVEGVDDQRAVDSHRGIAVGAVERQAAAEASSAAMIRMLCLGVGPNGHHLGRRLRLVVAA